MGNNSAAAKINDSQDNNEMQNGTGFNIRFTPREDKDKRQYWIAKVKLPISLNFSEGVALFLWETGENDYSLVIRPAQFLTEQPMRQRTEGQEFCAHLKSRTDRKNNPYWMGKMKTSDTIDFSKGIALFLWESGEEDFSLTYRQAQYVCKNSTVAEEKKE